MIKNLPKTLFVLLLSTTFILTMSGIGICLDKTKVDLTEYKGNNTNRTFTAFKFADGNRVRGTLTLVFTDTENGFHLEWDESYNDEASSHSEYDYDVTDKGVFEKSVYRLRGGVYHTFVYLASPPTQSNLVAKPILVFPYVTVDVGYMWGDAFIEKAEGAHIDYPRVNQYAIVGLEDVTVPAGTYTDCIMIARIRANQADRIAWYAKGVGLVKMIYAQEEPGYNRSYELFSFDE